MVFGNKPLFFAVSKISAFGIIPYLPKEYLFLNSNDLKYDLLKENLEQNH